MPDGAANGCADRTVVVVGASPAPPSPLARPLASQPVEPPTALFYGNLLTFPRSSSIIIRQAVNRHLLLLEKYSRGRRGAPAKGVGRVTGARVQIPPSPPQKGTPFSGCLFVPWGIWTRATEARGSRRNPFGERVSASDKPENLVLRTGRSPPGAGLGCRRGR